MNAPHQLRRLKIDRVLLAVNALLVPRHIREKFDAVRKLGERKLGFLAVRVEIVIMKTLEIANENPARKLVFRQRFDVLPSLPRRFFEVFSARLHFDNDRSLPKEIDVTVRTVEFRDFFLERRDFTPRYPKNVQKFNFKLLRVGLFAGRVAPTVGERRGAGFDFVHRERHKKAFLSATSRFIEPRRGEKRSAAEIKRKKSEPPTTKTALETTAKVGGNGSRSKT